MNPVLPPPGHPVRALHGVSMKKEQTRRYEIPSERLDEGVEMPKVQEIINLFEAQSHHSEKFPNKTASFSTCHCRHDIESRSPLSNDESAPNDSKLIDRPFEDSKYRQFIEEKFQNFELQLSRQISQNLCTMKSEAKHRDNLRYNYYS